MWGAGKVCVLLKKSIYAANYGSGFVRIMCKQIALWILPCALGALWALLPSGTNTMSNLSRDDRARVGLREMWKIAKKLPREFRGDRETDMLLRGIDKRLREVRTVRAFRSHEEHDVLHDALLEFLEFYVPKSVIEDRLGVRVSEDDPEDVPLFIAKSFVFQIMLRVVDWLAYVLVAWPVMFVLRWLWDMLWQ